jgi:hypothetical protein
LTVISLLVRLGLLIPRGLQNSCPSLAPVSTCKEQGPARAAHVSLTGYSHISADEFQCFVAIQFLPENFIRGLFINFAGK